MDSKTTGKLDLIAIIEDLFMVLSSKEKEVIVKRFSLNNEPRQTLERIGQHFAVTRERIRQIEKIALSKLRRTAAQSKLQTIQKYGMEILNEHGKLLIETELVSQILKRLATHEATDAHITRLALTVAPNLVRVDRAKKYHPFWRTDELPESLATTILQTAYQLLAKKKDIINEKELITNIQTALKEKDGKVVPEETLRSALPCDLRLKKVEEGWGLMQWRHINPKSIRDKAFIILKKTGKPLHFIEIANRITQASFDKKVVTVQAVHNELIRDEAFVLVGRGLYGLKEWGYKRGTVADIIEDLLRKRNPLSKQEIVTGVLKQRYVKKGTISLNLQKNPHFVRVGRAVYTLDLAKKVEHTGRRRGG